MSFTKEEMNGPYNWPTRGEWQKLTRDERIAMAERFRVLSRLRAARGVARTDAMRHADELLAMAKATPVLSDV